MNVGPSGNNLNVNEIFAKLDAMDSRGTDGKIEASIWNSFADVAGGKHIKNFINKDNALKSISAYIARASEDVKNKISDFVKNSNASSTNNTSATDSSSTANTTGETVEESDIIKKWKAGIKQAKEEQPKLEEKIGAKASNGMSYKEAQGIMRRLVGRWGRAMVATMEGLLSIPSHEEIEYLESAMSQPSFIGQFRDQLELLRKAKSAIYELERENPDIFKNYKKYYENKSRYGKKIYTEGAWKNEMEQMKRWDRLTRIDTTGNSW